MLHSQPDSVLGLDEGLYKVDGVWCSLSKPFCWVSHGIFN